MTYILREPNSHGLPLYSTLVGSFIESSLVTATNTSNMVTNPSPGQLASQYPFIYLMSRLPLTKFVGVTVCVTLHHLGHACQGLSG